MIPQTPLCVADRNTYWVRKLFCEHELLAAMCLAGRVPLMVRRAKSGICKNFGAESAHSGKIALTVLGSLLPFAAYVTNGSDAEETGHSQL